MSVRTMLNPKTHLHEVKFFLFALMLLGMCQLVNRIQSVKQSVTPILDSHRVQDTNDRSFTTPLP